MNCWLFKTSALCPRPLPAGRGEGGRRPGEGIVFGCQFFCHRIKSFTNTEKTTGRRRRAIWGRNGRPSTSARVTSCAPRSFCRDDRFHASCEIASVTFDVQLEIQPQAARVPVGRAKQDPMAVHNHQLGMVEGRRREPEVAAAFEHLPPHRARRPMDEWQIVFGRAE